MPLATDQVSILKQKLQSEGAAGLLDALEAELRKNEKFHELFEVLKMKTRHRLGLPAIHFPDEEEVDSAQRDELEDGLFEVCREVGILFLKKGQIQEGWVYLRPVGDTKLVAEMLRDIEATDENLDALIGICLSEGVDPERGFDLVLERYGTCNAITTFESEMPRRSIAEQRIAAGRLVEHLYAELKPNLIHDILRRANPDSANPDGAPSEAGGVGGEETDNPELEKADDGPTTLSPIEAELESQSIAELIEGRDEIFEEHAYHIDTTHLASVVRFAKLLNEPEALAKARELAEYGCRLSTQYHYEGEEPFTDVYADHARFLDVLLGHDVEGGLAFFKEKAESVDAYSQGTMAAEVYVDLLCRTGRYEQALEASIELLQGKQNMGIAPSLLEICREAKSYDRLFEYCQSRDDLLGFGTGLLLSEAEQRATE